MLQLLSLAPENTGLKRELARLREEATRLQQLLSATDDGAQGGVRAAEAQRDEV